MRRDPVARITKEMNEKKPGRMEGYTANETRPSRMIKTVQINEKWTRKMENYIRLMRNGQGGWITILINEKRPEGGCISILINEKLSRRMDNYTD
jgi:hypothetical protein